MFELDYYNAGGAGGLTLVAVPEPGSIAMLTGLALMGLLYWRRRKSGQ